MLPLSKVITLGGVLLYSSFALAQPQTSPYYQQQLADLVVLTEELAQEVRELRGIVEQQSYELRKIQQQRIDDYRSLDKRIADLGEASISSSEDSAVTELGAEHPAAVAPPLGLSEKEVYRQAYTLVKNRDFDNAVQAFERFLVQFPDGSYAGNAYYWLGELFDLRGDLPNAQKSMVALISQFPDHRKVPDAHYKLAKIFHKMGDAEQAKTHANLVIDQFSANDVTAVKLAQEFLAKNYP